LADTTEPPIEVAVHPPKIPTQVRISNVAPGTNAGSSGGVYLTADSLITARLTGDDSAFFTIAQPGHAGIGVESESFGAVFFMVFP
jgi:hypothetical protein